MRTFDPPYGEYQFEETVTIEQVTELDFRIEVVFG